MGTLWPLQNIQPLTNLIPFLVTHKQSGASVFSAPENHDVTTTSVTNDTLICSFHFGQNVCASGCSYNSVYVKARSINDRDARSLKAGQVGLNGAIKTQGKVTERSLRKRR